MKKLNIFAAWVFLLALVTGCGSSSEEETAIVDVSENGATSVIQTELESQLSVIPLGELSQQESDGLVYMREEEKLAHDVYTLLFDRWQLNVFTNIANSESTHTDAILTLLNNYGLDDPAEGNAVGVFTNPVLQSLSDMLVANGAVSLIDALMVGAAIEEIDMIDIQHYIDQVEGNEDIILVYENLLKGSRNHLRSFVSTLESQGVVYVPQYMDQADYDSIINSPIERG